MSPLGKRVVVFTMLWVLLVMTLSQIYDNVTGKGMPPRSDAVATVEPTVQPDADIARLAELQSCVAANPEDLECLSELGELYYAAGQYPQAQVNFERAVRLKPRDDHLLLRLAGCYIYQQKFEQAAATLQEAAAIRPDSPEIHLLFGLALSRLNPPRTDEAVSEWRKVIELAPRTALASQAAQFINETGK